MNSTGFGENATNVHNNVLKNSMSLYDFMIPSFGIIIIIANLAVVISSGLILKKGQEPRSTYLFLGNVALTDLLTGVSVVFGQVLPRAFRDHYVCSLQIGMIVSSTLASVFSVGLIAIDRYLYILYGLKYTSWVYPQRARFLIGFTWILGCLIGFMPLFGWHGYTDNGRICWFILLAPKELVLLTVIFGVIPLVIVVVLYSIILFHALKKIFQLQNIDNQQENNPTKDLRMFKGNNSQECLDQEKLKGKGFMRLFRKKPSRSLKGPSKWKAIKVVLFTSGSFFCTWSPYFIVSLLYVNNCDFSSETEECKTMRILIASPLAILGFMNSLLNPIIYAWWHKGFRKFVKRRITVFKMNTVNVALSNSNNTQSTNSSRKNSTSSNSNIINESPN